MYTAQLSAISYRPGVPVASSDRGIPYTRFRLTRGHLHALLIGNLVAHVAFWLLYAARRFVVAPFGTDDFAVFRSAALLALDGRGSHVYDADYLRAFQASLGMPEVMPYLYPPFFLVAMLPFALLPPALGYLLWGAANLGLLALAAWLLARAFVPRGERLTFALLVCSSYPAGAALDLGQTSFVLLLGAALAAIGFVEGRDRLGGIALAALLIKPQLLPAWLLMLAWCRRWRALLCFAGVAVAALLVASPAVVGPDGAAGYFRAVLEAASEHRVGFQAPGSHSLAGLAYGVGGETSSRVAYLALAAVTLAAYVWLLHGLRRQTPENLRIAAAATSVVAILLSSHTLLYDLILWAVPLALCWPELSRGRGRWLIAAGYGTPWFVSFFGMLGAGFVWPTVAVMLLGLGLLGHRALRAA